MQDPPWCNNRCAVDVPPTTPMTQALRSAVFVATALTVGLQAERPGSQVLRRPQEAAQSSRILRPTTLAALTPLVSGGQTVHVNVLNVVQTLLIGQVLPLLTGLIVNHRWPQRAATWVKPAGQLTKLLNLIFLALVFYTQFESLLKVPMFGFIGLVLLTISSVAVGWLLGGPDRAGRKGLALTTGVRNNGLGVAIATGSFAGTPAIATAAVFGVIGFISTLVVAVVWGKLAKASAPEGVPA